MKRIERKKLHEDELATGLTKFYRFIKRWTRELLVAGGVIVFLLLVYVVFQIIKTHNLGKENQLITQILTLRAEIDKKPENLAKLEKIGGNGKFSRIVYIELATYWIEKADLVKAEEALAKIKDTPKDLVYYQAQDLLGQVYGKRKDYAKAVDLYKRIEKDNPKAYLLDAILFHMAEIHEQKGDKAEAIALYKKLQEKYSQSYYGYDASQRLSKLEAGK